MISDDAGAGNTLGLATSQAYAPFQSAVTRLDEYVDHTLYGVKPDTARPPLKALQQYIEAHGLDIKTTGKGRKKENVFADIEAEMKKRAEEKAKMVEQRAHKELISYLRGRDTLPKLYVVRTFCSTFSQTFIEK